LAVAGISDPLSDATCGERSYAEVLLLLGVEILATPGLI
jgi:hypothetical protein